MLTKIVSETPARVWQEGFPLGDGEIGATVQGAIAVERILFNHEKLFLPSEKDFDFSPKPEVTEAVKREVAAGNYKKAENLLAEGFPIEHPCPPYQPLAELFIRQDIKGVKKHYRRTLDFARAEVKVTFESDGVKYLRRSFVSHADGLFVHEITNNENVPMKAQFFLIGRALESEDYGDPNPPLARTLYTRATDFSDGRVDFVGTYPSGDKFGATMVYETDGTVSPTRGHIGGEEGILIENFTRFFCKVTMFAYGKRAPEAAEGDYDTLFRRHLSVWKKHYCKSSITFGNYSDVPTTERMLLDAADDTVPPALFELLFAASRYYFLCSTLKGTLPPNLQGIWNGDYAPAWNCDFHNDENVQMCMWQALPFGAFESVRNYMRYYTSCIPDYRLNAKRYFGASGIAAPCAQTTTGKGLNEGMWNLMPGMAGWIGKLYFDYYLATGDEKVLENEVMPYLEGVAEFYRSYLCEEDGVWHFIPSMSPENEPKIDYKGKPRTADNAPSLVCRDATFDLAVAKEVLFELIEGCRVLGRDASEYQKMLEKMPSYRVNSDGALAEWLPEELGDNYEHRHLSNIYPAFPGTEITPEGTPDLWRAAQTAVKFRVSKGITDSSAWGLVHTACAFVRLGLPEDAKAALDVLFRGAVMPNMLTYHNAPIAQGNNVFWGEKFTPFQIDATLGYAAAIAEMFVQSAPGVLRIAPAVPKDFGDAVVSGIFAPGGVTVDLKMKKGKVTDLTLRAKKGYTVTLSVNGTSFPVTLRRGENKISV